MNIHLRLLQCYWFLERRIVPDLKFSQLQYETALFSSLREGDRWLDLGCGNRILPGFRADSERELVRRADTVVGIDRSEEQLARNRSIRWRLLATGEQLPFREASFDLVTANMVVEHLDDPVGCFAEVKRVLRPGGRFLFHTPNANGYGPRLAGSFPDVVKKGLARVLEEREEEDVFPVRYRANTDSEIRRVARLSGLDVESVDTHLSVAQTARIPPLAVVELLWLRRLRRPERWDERPIIISSLRRPPEAPRSLPSSRERSTRVDDASHGGCETPAQSSGGAEM